MSGPEDHPGREPPSPDAPPRAAHIDDPARKELRLEEYKMLKSEIATLDARVERGITTVLAINALVLTVIYLGFLPLFGALHSELDDDQRTALKLPLIYALILLNVVLIVRYDLMMTYIDRIGGYIKRLEEEIYYCKPDQKLGWERSMRGKHPVRSKKQYERPDTVRRRIIWGFVLLVNIAALLDLHCILSITGMTECPAP